MSDRLEIRTISKSKWVEIFPYGVTVAADDRRPVLIFKDVKKELVLPVWLSALDAHMAMSSSRVGLRSQSSHKVPHSVLGALNVKLEKVLFKEIKGHHQYVELTFKSPTKIKNLKVRAEDAMSFCLQSECSFHCTRSYANDCRQLDMENIAPDTFGVRPVVHKLNARYLN